MFTDVLFFLTLALAWGSWGTQTLSAASAGSGFSIVAPLIFGLIMMVLCIGCLMMAAIGSYLLAQNAFMRIRRFTSV